MNQELEIKTTQILFGPVEAAILGLGLAARLAFFLTGRVPLDGDEVIMGIMGLRLSRMEDFPLYFYGQDYMGALEVPPLALLMALGPEAWAVSAWPIRVVAAAFFTGLGYVHFKLAAAFFGRRPARYALFFLCFAPIFWMEYSLRLRHVVFMMFLGETLTLMTLGLLFDRDRWGGFRLGRVFALGFLVGVAWWHYQAVVYFLI